MKTLAEKMFTVKPLMDNVYGISGSAVMMYLVVGKEKAMLIDTGYGFADVREIINKLTGLPLIVVNSHGHIDHSGGNFYFDEPVHIHKADADVYKKHNSPEFHRIGERVLKQVQHIFFWKKIITKHPEENDEKRINYDNFHFVNEGDHFNLGGLTAEIIEIPGHTAGSIAVYVPEKRIVFASDGANSNPWLFLPESQPLSKYVESLHKLENLDFDYIITGHSSRLFPKAILRSWLNVAENPDIENAKISKESPFTPGIQAMRVWARGSKSKKGPSIEISKENIDI